MFWHFWVTYVLTLLTYSLKLVSTISSFGIYFALLGRFRLRFHTLRVLLYPVPLADESSDR